MRLVDCSVVTPLILVEEFSPQARALVHEAERQHDDIIAPRLLEYEISNAIRKAVRQGRIDASDAEARLRVFDILPITFLTDRVHHEALAIALRYNLPAAYDAHYLALAERLGCDFWTADERLVNQSSGALPGVRWLGSVAVAEPPA